MWEVTLGEDAMPSEITESWTFQNDSSTGWGTVFDTSHSMPANGWAYVLRKRKPSKPSFSVYGWTASVDTTNPLPSYWRWWNTVSANNASESGYIPVSKGEKILYRGIRYANDTFDVTFVYSVGEAKRLGLL